MSTFTTSKSHPVSHCHLGQAPCKTTDHSPAHVAKILDWVSRHHPNATVTNPPTNRYNCIGFALARSHGWFHEFEPFYADDYVNASFASPAEGDVMEYRREAAFMHVAVVTRVSNGRIVRVRSKWANGPELSHAPDDHLEDYGEPSRLLRPRPGVVPFLILTEEEEEALEPVGEARSAALRGDEEMSDFESTEEAIQWALGRISDPDVYIRVNFASTPETARVIIERLPGVKELIDIGQEAAPSILTLLQRAEEQEEDELAGIALYLLQRIPTEEAKKPLARAIVEGRFTGLNMYLAADALLTSARTDVVNENPITTALREAEKLNSTE